MVKVYKTAYITRGDEELEVEVEADVSPLIPARGPSWDSPGEPAEGGEVELESVTHNGVELELTAEESDKLLNYISENLTGDEFDDGPDYYEDFE